MKLPKEIMGVKVNAVSVAITSVVAIIAGVVIYRKVKKAFEGVGEGVQERDYVKNIKKDKNSEPLSHDKSWYVGAADRLRRAFEGAGTTWSTVKDVMSNIKNKTDWAQLVEEFGIFKARSGMWPAAESRGNLMSWLELELGSGEMRTVQDILMKANVEL